MRKSVRRHRYITSGSKKCCAGPEGSRAPLPRHVALQRYHPDIFWKFKYWFTLRNSAFLSEIVPYKHYDVEYLDAVFLCLFRSYCNLLWL